MLTAFRQKYIGDRRFYTRYIALAVPMIIQNAITNFVSFLDNIMVGQLGTEQMTGVAIVNQLYFVYSLAVFGIVSAASIFGAQFYGKGDHQGHMYTFRFRLYTTMVLSVLAMVFFTAFGSNLISLFLTGDSGDGNAVLTLAFGQEYLKWVMVGFIPFTLTQIYASIIKETGQTVVPMIAGMSGVVANAFFDWVLIFGIGPAPALGVAGAAIATVIARIIECGVVIIWAHTHHAVNRYLENAFRGMTIPADLFKQIVVKGTPLMINEVMWAAGMTMLTQSYSVRGLDVVSALNISNTINNLFNIVFIQLGSCISIVVGQYLGAGKLEEAKDADNKMIFFTVACCTGMSVIMLLTGHMFPAIYNTSDGIKSLATNFIYVQALVMPFVSFNHATYFTLRSGGKTFVTFLFDSLFTWVIMVPTAVVLCRFTGLGIVTVFFIVTFTELIKNVLGYFMVRSNVWLVRIV